MRGSTDHRPVKYIPYPVTTAVAIGVVIVLGTVESVGRETIAIRAEDAVHFAGLLIAASALILRARWPLIAVAVTGAVNVVALLYEWPSPGYQVAWLIAIFSFTLVASLRMSIIVSSVCVAAGVAAVMLTGDWGWLSMKPLSIVITVLFAAGLGYTFQVRDERVRTSAALAAAAEANRATEVERHLNAQRLATARELHDAVGHQLTVISLNAGNALEALDVRPPDARRALHTIEDAAAGLIEEVGRVLEQLRSSGEATPGKGLSDLPSLIARFQREHLIIDFRMTEGAAPDARGDVAYQVVQEALVNALRYADTAYPVRVNVVVGDPIVIDVVNHVSDRGTVSAGTRFGLRGIAERVEPLGGHVSGERRDGLFVLQATVPSRVEAGT
ncbi:sensor histidine kinase [Microbacterium thalassium]|uniref:histidine kinase n=1 Tax=Microbacterium thalassium TaxID=362649 RepID=A0A7X0FN28_9MICO|nr:histidine kinase [Microbacterium thalassium]MBB6390534.1 signal transduction histidine kinase [Microbacterium thalassium]GLK25645.1 two-component sensor histidine kinase [Microbacterium thalassium]